MRHFRTLLLLVIDSHMIEIEDQSPNNPFQIDTDDSPAAAVVEFINTHLPSFPTDFKEMRGSTIIEGEEDISQELCNYLQNRTYGPTQIFMFQFERKRLKSPRKSDFGVIARSLGRPQLSRAFFVIEAKRLPPPGADREKEYVEGNYGGIERYKKGHHGIGLKESALLGYIQKEDSAYWFKRINGWINDLISSNTDADIEWNNDDVLVFDADLTTTQKYRSENVRIVDFKKDSITLHHYFINLN